MERQCQEALAQCLGHSQLARDGQPAECGMALERRAIPAARFDGPLGEHGRHAACHRSLRQQYRQGGVNALRRAALQHHVGAAFSERFKIEPVNSHATCAARFPAIERCERDCGVILGELGVGPYAIDQAFGEADAEIG